jgi:hypothetical protein
LFCFTFSQRRIGPAWYRLASSLATKPSWSGATTSAHASKPFFGEPTYGRYPIASGDDQLETRATLSQWPLSQLAAILVKQIERYEHRRRGDRVCIWFAQPVEARSQPLVEDRDLAVKYQGPRRQLRDRRRNCA